MEIIVNVSSYAKNAPRSTVENKYDNIVSLGSKRERNDKKIGGRKASVLHTKDAEIQNHGI